MTPSQDAPCQAKAQDEASQSLACPFSEKKSKRPAHEECMGEIGCVIEDKGKGYGCIRLFGHDFPVRSDEELVKGKWAIVVGVEDEMLVVLPINMWLASCCCG